MNLSSSSRPPFLYINFNQDFSCLSVGLNDGFKIFNTLPKFSEVFSQQMAGIGICEMLFCSSLVAVVGSGDHPSLSPRKLLIINTKNNSTICELNFVTPILSVRLNKKRVVVIMETRIHIYDISSMKILHSIETKPNPKGLCALSSNEENCYLAFPSSGAEAGNVVLFDALTLQPLNIINAHRSPLAKITFNQNGSLLATVSTKGTVVRVHNMSDVSKVYQYRRGTYPAVVHSISFSLDSSFLCVSSDTGTVHIFKSDQLSLAAASSSAPPSASSNAKQANFGMMSTFSSGVSASMASYLPEVLTDMWDTMPVRSFASAKLPTSFGSSNSIAEKDSLCAISSNNTSVMIVTSDGQFYQYSMDSKVGGELKMMQDISILKNNPPDDVALTVITYVLPCYSMSFISSSQVRSISTTFDVKTALQRTTKLPKKPTSFFWKNVDNQRGFFDSIEEAFGIKNKDQWLSVSKREIAKRGGGRILESYDGSLLEALKAIYPERDWDDAAFQKKERVREDEPKRVSYGYWNDINNQRQLMDSVAHKLGIKDSSDWKKFTAKDVMTNGGTSIIFRYDNSLFKALQNIYPDLTFKMEDFAAKGRVPKAYWLDQKNQRAFIDELRRDLHIVDYNSWKKISIKQITDRGGRGLLDLYQGSVLKALQTLYPEIDSTSIGMFTKSKFYYGDIDNQKKEFEILARKLKIEDSADWSRVTIKEINENGGRSLLQQYGGSLYEALSSVYPDIDFSREDFHNKPRGYWSDVNNQRNFFEKIAKEFGIVEDSEWGRVTQREVHERGGNVLLSIYKNSLWNALRAVYPEKNFKESDFSSLKYRHINSTNDHRNILDQIAEDLHVRNPADWSTITVKTFIEAGGKPLLNHFGSIIKAVQALYPTDPSKTPSKRPVNYFKDLINQRKFLDTIAEEIQIVSKDSHADWSKVTIRDILDRGGYALLQQYDNSMFRMLKSVYPEYKLNPEDINQAPGFVSKGQLGMWEILRNYVDDLQMNYRGTLMIHSSEKNMELDFYSESNKLAIEYQGMHHYQETHRGSLERQKLRDAEKRIACEELGLSLVEIPYWWDGTESQLIATLKAARPDIKAFSNHSIEGALTNKPPEASRGESQLMMPSEFSSVIDPIGWFLFQKFEGVKVFWDGEKMFNDRGKQFSIPIYFKQGLPAFSLDGFLWMKNKSEDLCRQVTSDARKSLIHHWMEVVFLVMDTPRPGTFSERLKFLNESLQISSNRSDKFKSLQMMPMTYCKDINHLMDEIEISVRNPYDRGIYFKNPDASYVPGRSSSFLDLQLRHTDEAIILSQAENSNLVVLNTLGKKFEIERRVKEGAELLTSGKILSYRFSGLKMNGTPHLPIIRSIITSENKWSDWVNYRLTLGSIHANGIPSCRACRTRFSRDDWRVKVKGLYYHENTRMPPQYVDFSFCPKASCLTLVSNNTKRVHYPNFQFKVLLVDEVESDARKRGVPIFKFDDSIVQTIHTKR